MALVHVRALKLCSLYYNIHVDDSSRRSEVVYCTNSHMIVFCIWECWRSGLDMLVTSECWSCAVYMVSYTSKCWRCAVYVLSCTSKCWSCAVCVLSCTSCVCYHARQSAEMCSVCASMHVWELKLCNVCAIMHVRVLKLCSMCYHVHQSAEAVQCMFIIKTACVRPLSSIQRAKGHHHQYSVQ